MEEQPETNGSVSAEAIPKGTLIKISGLQSPAGQKLNGSHGIILGKPTVSNDALRYPVAIYASKDKTILSSPKNNSIKSENLQVQEDQSSKIFQQAAPDFSRDAHGRNDTKNMILWLELYCPKFPEDFLMGATYANFLREIKKDSKGSLHMFDQLDSKYPSDHPGYFEFCYDVSVTNSQVGRNLAKALEFALKIPISHPELKQLAKEALMVLGKACHTAIREDPRLENAAASDIQIQVMKELCDREPGAVEHCVNLGAAYCLAGDNIKGAKWYRKALASGKLDSSSAHDTKINLITAQLQCSGHPLEDKIVMGFNGNRVTLVDKSDRDHCNFKSASKDGNSLLIHGQSGMIIAPNEDVAVTFYTIPDDPDDTKVFSKELLREISV